MGIKTQKLMLRIMMITIGLFLTGMSLYAPTLFAAVSEEIYCTVTITQQPPLPTNFGGIPLSTSSIQWSWDNIINEDGYRVYTDTDGFKIQVDTDVVSWQEPGLNANAQYTRYVRSFNSAGESGNSNQDSIYTLANPPTGLTSPAQTQNSISLSWAPGAGGNTRYAVEQAPDNSGVPGSWSFILNWSDNLASNNYTNNSLTPDTTYWYRVSGYNGDGIITAASNIISALTSPSTDTLAPREPSGINGSLSSDQSGITLSWRAVTINSDGTTCTDLAGYNIYRTNDLHGTTWIKVNTSPITGTSWTDNTILGGTYYYKITTQDLSNNESINSTMIIDSSPEVNIISLASDLYTGAMIPKTANAILFRETNPYTDDLIINVTEQISFDAISAFIFTATTYDTNENVTYISSQAEVKIVLYYPVTGGMINGTNINAAEADGQIAISWYNGVEWVELGGSADITNQTISISTKYLGQYKIIQKLRATEFKLVKIYPRIFSPNNDGINDLTNFIFENPENKQITGKIYDLSGSFVADLSTGDIENSLIWDGKYSDGRVVKSGAYIYQIKCGNKKLNGTIVVAK